MISFSSQSWRFWFIDFWSSFNISKFEAPIAQFSRIGCSKLLWFESRWNCRSLRSSCRKQESSHSSWDCESVADNWGNQAKLAYPLSDRRSLERKMIWTSKLQRKWTLCPFPHSKLKSNTFCKNSSKNKLILRSQQEIEHSSPHIYLLCDEDKENAEIIDLYTFFIKSWAVTE